MEEENASEVRIKVVVHRNYKCVVITYLSLQGTRCHDCSLINAGQAHTLPSLMQSPWKKPIMRKKAYSRIEEDYGIIHL